MALTEGEIQSEEQEEKDEHFRNVIFARYCVARFNFGRTATNYRGNYRNVCKKYDICSIPISTSQFYIRNELRTDIVVP